MRPGCEAERGKIKEALFITTTYQEEIEADLQRYYGLDLFDLYRPGSGLTWGKFLALVHGLPSESALSTAVRNNTPVDELDERIGDPTKSSWSLVESLLAALIDEVRNVGWMYASTHSDRKVPRPTPIPRPGVDSTRHRRVNVDNLKAIDPRLRDLSDEEALDQYRRMTGRG